MSASSPNGCLKRAPLWAVAHLYHVVVRMHWTASLSVDANLVVLNYLKVECSCTVMDRPCSVWTNGQSMASLPWDTKPSDTKIVDFMALDERVLVGIGKRNHEQYFFLDHVEQSYDEKLHHTLRLHS